MRILYDHQVFSLQDAGGASRYHFELVRNLQGSDGVELEMLMGLTGSVMPFPALGQTHTKILAHGTRIKPGVAAVLPAAGSDHRPVRAELILR